MLIGETGAGVVAFSKHPIGAQPPATCPIMVAGRAKVPLRDELMLGEQVGTQTGPLPPQFSGQRTHSKYVADRLKKARGKTDVSAQNNITTEWNLLHIRLTRREAVYSHPNTLQLTQLKLYRGAKT